MSYSSINDVLLDCHGFALSIFDAESVEQASSSWILMMLLLIIKQISTLSRMTKAVNTAAGLNSYGIIFYLPMDFQLIDNSLSYLNKNTTFVSDVGFFQKSKQMKS